MGSPSYEFSNCSDLIATGLKLDNTFVIPVKAKVIDYLGDDCKAGCSSYSVGGVTFETDAAFKIEIGGIFQTTVSQKISIPISDPIAEGGSCK